MSKLSKQKFSEVIKLQFKGRKKIDEYECWNCKETMLPDSIYVVFEPDLREVIAKFCSNPECNLLHASLTSGRYVKSSVHGWSSWNDRSVYSKMPQELRDAYREACKSFVNDCHLATVLVCRTMIAYAAIDKKSVSESFKGHIGYLESKNLISSDVGAPLDKVRGLGNDATHELIKVINTEALIVLITLDTALKRIYSKSEM